VEALAQAHRLKWCAHAWTQKNHVATHWFACLRHHLWFNSHDILPERLLLATLLLKVNPAVLMAKLRASALKENLLHGIDSIGDSNNYDSRDHKQVSSVLSFG
jgi:hypothetical protein